MEPRNRWSVRNRVLLFAVLLGAAAVASCGGSSSYGPPPPGPTPGAKANVLVLLTATANDALVDFGVQVATLSLADSKGNEVKLFDASNSTTILNGAAGEFVHLNGVSEPLVSVSIPQATYTSATVTVGSCSFTTVSLLNTGGLDQSTYAEGLCGQGTGDATITLSSPLNISGQAVVLSLDLQQAQSFTLNGTGANAAYSVSPAFTLSPVPISSNPTSDENGKLAGIDMQIISVNGTGNGFTATIPDGVVLQVTTDNDTTYQGITDFASLSVGTLLDADLIIQPDASLKASRIEVDDTTAPMEVAGQYFTPINQPGGYTVLSIQREGCAASPQGAPFCGLIFQSDASTAFKISERFENMSSLPFAPVFSAATVFPGQNLATYSPGTFTNQGTEPSTTITLIPQTINGTVASMSNQNGFAVYTVTLAPYDLIPVLQNQVAIPVVSNPQSLTVYVDTNTLLLNSGEINVGSLLRFNGIIFFDNGTLRMDCAQIKDGVAE